MIGFEKITHKEWSGKTSEEQNELVHEVRLDLIRVFLYQDEIMSDFVINIPCRDYVNDLNAMYSAEETLGIGGQEDMMKYVVQIENMIKKESGRGCMWDVFHSPANIRAEAFCMAWINLGDSIKE
jgi:hypothetical protein